MADPQAGICIQGRFTTDAAGSGELGSGNCGLKLSRFVSLTAVDAMRIEFTANAIRPQAPGLPGSAQLPAFALEGGSVAASAAGLPLPGTAQPSQRTAMANLLLQLLGHPPPANWRLRELDPTAVYPAALPEAEEPQTLSLELQLVSADGRALPARLTLAIFAAAREQAPALLEALRKHDPSLAPGPMLDRPASELAGQRFGFEWIADHRTLWSMQALAMRGWLQIRPREQPRKPPSYSDLFGGALDEFAPEEPPTRAAAAANDGGPPVLGVGQWLLISARTLGSWLKAYW